MWLKSVLPGLSLLKPTTELLFGFIVTMILYSGFAREGEESTGSLLPELLLATLLLSGRAAVHLVRSVHAVRRLRRGALIIDDLFGSTVLTLWWILAVAGLWMPSLRELLVNWRLP